MNEHELDRPYCVVVKDPYGKRDVLMLKTYSLPEAYDEYNYWRQNPIVSDAVVVLRCGNETLEEVKCNGSERKYERRTDLG